MGTQNKNDTEKGKNRLTRRDFIKAGGAAVVSALLFNSLASCTKATTPLKSIQTSAPTSLPPVTSSIDQMSSNPKYGGILTIFTASPAGANLGWPAQMAQVGGDTQWCLETLLRGDNQGNVHPWLAESYKVADDRSSITFIIKQGIKFHDGSDLNADVVKWNLDNMIDAKMEPYWASVDVLDDYMVRVNFAKWIATLPMSFAEGSTVAYMVSRAAFEQHGSDWMSQNPVGTGAYKLQSFVRDVNLKIMKNPDYWIQGRPYLNEISVVYVNDSTTVRMLIEQGEGDMVVNPALGKQTADYTKLGLNIKYTLDANQGFIPDTANPDSPWANQKVREAVEYAIDKEGMARAFGYGYWIAPYQLPARDSLAYDPNYTDARKYDPAKAKQLLTEAGYPEGFKTTIISEPSTIRDVVVAVQGNLDAVGIKAELDFPDSAAFGKYIFSGTWPKGTALIMPFPRFDRSYIGGLQFLNTIIGQSWLKTPEFLAAYQAVLDATTVDVNLIRAAANVINKDASLIPIYSTGISRADRSYVIADFDQRNSVSFQNIETWWLDKGV